jgi:hypothetical protein
MSTEQRVLAMLTKVQKVQEVKKENLGAIEDAINDVKSNLADLRDEMVAITRQLETGISVYGDASAKATSDLSDVMKETDDQFFSLQQQAFILANELDNLGISYDVDIEKTKNDFDTLYGVADSKI